MATRVLCKHVAASSGIWQVQGLTWRTTVDNIAGKECYLSRKCDPPETLARCKQCIDLSWAPTQPYVDIMHTAVLNGSVRLPACSRTWSHSIRYAGPSYNYSSTIQIPVVFRGAPIENNRALNLPFDRHPRQWQITYCSSSYSQYVRRMSMIPPLAPSMRCGYQAQQYWCYPLYQVQMLLHPQQSPYITADTNMILNNKRQIRRQLIRTGRITCKKRHVKCDEAKPQCMNWPRSKRCVLDIKGSLANCCQIERWIRHPKKRSIT